MAKQLKDYREYLKNSRIPIRLACRTKSGWPVVVSLWYIHLDGSLYLATKQDARVVSYLNENPECAFEISADIPPYCGIRGQALATIGREQGVEILGLLLDRYLGGRDNDLAKNLLANSANEVSIRLDPVNIYSWNFSSRMSSISADMQILSTKTCP